MPEHEREDGARLKEIVAWMNVGAALGVAALLGVGGYLLLVDDGVSPSGSTPSIESPEDAAPRPAAAADTDAPAPIVSPPAVESPTARAAETPVNRLPASGGGRNRPAAAAGNGVRASGASSPAVARATEDSLNLGRTDRRRIQAGLSASGRNPGPADGVFGTGTRAAIRDWQAFRGAPSTGYLDAVEAEELIALSPGGGEGRRADVLAPVVPSPAVESPTAAEVPSNRLPENRLRPQARPRSSGPDRRAADAVSGADARAACTCSLRDRDVLVAFYHSTDGANAWWSDSSWLSERPLNRWRGVTADRNGCVTRLELSGNRLAGEIPSQLGNLSRLEHLDVSRNELAGTIPSQLGNLPRLEYLDVSDNDLTGTIPAALGNLSNLVFLDMSENSRLRGAIPPQLGNLSQLAHLDISDQRGQPDHRLYALSGGIPPELGNLTNLRVLDLSFNRLSGSVPAQLGALAHLEYLGLHSNDLSGAIPAELGRLSELEQLRLNHNELTGEIPAELASLRKLRWLFLRFGNRFTGCVPRALRPEGGDLGRLGLPSCGGAGRPSAGRQRSR